MTSSGTTDPLLTRAVAAESVVPADERARPPFEWRRTLRRWWPVAVVALPIVFPLLMVVGAVLGMRAIPLPPVELGIAVSVFVLGLCVAGAWRAPAWLAVAIVAVFALFHGYAHGRELPSAADPVGYSAGFVLATGLLHVGGIAFAVLAARVRRVPLTRAAGAAIALAGVFFLHGVSA